MCICFLFSSKLGKHIGKTYWENTLEMEKEYLDALVFKDKFNKSSKLRKLYHIDYIWDNIINTEKKMEKILEQLEHCC